MPKEVFNIQKKNVKKIHLLDYLQQKELLKTGVYNKFFDKNII